MDSSEQSSPPPQPPNQSATHTLLVRSKPGGFRSALGFIIGLAVFFGIFIIGIGLGAFSVMAGSNVDTVTLEQTYREGGADTVAIIPIEGAIDDRQARYVRSAVEHVLDDRSIKAVVLRVDSPGGGVTASDQIWYEIERLKKRNLPVVASFGALAASGGYYVACGADHIVAEETCVTGSIGVIAQVFTFEGLMDKAGVKPVTLVASGSPEKAVANNPFRDWNERDQEKILAMLDAAYGTFHDRVTDGRQHVIEPDRIDDLANGSIYTAAQAHESGLVDSIGYLDDAIVEAESQANLSAGSATVLRLVEPPSPFGGMFSARAEGPAGFDAFDADAVRGLVNELSSPRVMYLMH